MGSFIFSLLHIIEKFPPRFCFNKIVTATKLAVQMKIKLSVVVQNLLYARLLSLSAQWQRRKS
jgi:hypothetical protein